MWSDWSAMSRQGGFFRIKDSEEKGSKTCDEELRNDNEDVVDALCNKNQSRKRQKKKQKI